LLASYRTEEIGASPLLQRLMEFSNRAGTDMDVRELQVSELTADEASAMALALMGDRGPASLTRAAPVARESGGSPYFVEELARYQNVDQSAGDLTTLDEVIRQRVSRLPEDPRRLLEVVAVAGQPVDRQVARQAANIERDEHAAIGLLRAA